MKTAKRLADLPTYAAAEVVALKRKLVAAGVDVIDLGAGDADFAPPDIAVQAVAEALKDPRMSRYGFQVGHVPFREAIARYMRRRFGVVVDPMTEVLPLIGSKDGLAHLPFAVLDPGDIAVVPEPGYPAYAGGVALAGGEAEVCPLTAAQDFLVNLEDLPGARRARTRLAFLNYPNNPTTAVAPAEYLARTVEFCRRHEIVLAYDNPYCELTFDGYRAPSIFEFPGARDVALEFHSLSKSFSMTGWRVGWVCGNAALIAALAKVKTYTDTGPFLALQAAGVAVLDRAEELVRSICARFLERRDAAVSALREIGVPADSPRATMYLWVPLPEHLSSAEFARALLEREGVVVLHGSSFGRSGEGFFRVALTVGPERLREAAGRMAKILEHFGAASAAR
ncbi:MAG: aminotransferase class I/II-fold pyridoxal phosphate-dependent enzyme [Gemmatimonadetes bacterium]|nr:aminotransferase class I/II-fold pyridoxal phosphate-dependent enzyme [Gemmatimonadota bacterium]